MAIDLEKRGTPTEPSSESSVKEGTAQVDVFGDEENHDIRYKTLSWQVSRKTISWAQLSHILIIQFVSALMIAEIVSNGILSLPNAMAVVGELRVAVTYDFAADLLLWTGIVPSLVLTVFLGVFALYTAKLLIDFKLNHPEVHNMGTSAPVVRLSSCGDTSSLHQVTLSTLYLDLSVERFSLLGPSSLPYLVLSVRCNHYASHLC